MKDFQQLYKQYYQEVYHFLLRWTNGRADLAEELVQECFYQVFLSLPRYKGNSTIRTWIYQIAKNVACKYYEKNPILQSLEEHSLEDNCTCSKTNLEEQYILQEERRWLQQKILQLPEKYRDVMIYRIYYDMTYEQIAKSMGISVSSAKVLFHRGKQKIQAQTINNKNQKKG